ncbi:hypothetical protein OKW45_003870 [Paraburkholderia sp. WSM4175]
MKASWSAWVKTGRITNISLRTARMIMRPLFLWMARTRLWFWVRRN